MAQLAAVAILMVGSQLALIWLTRGLTHHTATTLRSVLPLILGLAVPTGLLLLAAHRFLRAKCSEGMIVGVFVVGVALRAVWVGSPPPLEDDFRRYLWDGAVVAHGLDPYRHAPEDFFASVAIPRGYEAIAAAGRETVEGTNFPDLRSIYPTVAQISFALAHLIAPFEVDGLRLVFLGAEVGTFVLLLALLAKTGASPLWSILYWWNPTVAFVLIGLAHVDALVPPFVLGALLSTLHARTGAAMVLLGAGAGVKLWPILLVPLVVARIAREPGRLAVAGILLTATLALAVGPVLLSAMRPDSGFTAYASSWGNNNAFFAWAVFALGVPLGDGVAEGLVRIVSVLAVTATALIVALRAETTTRALLGGSLVVAATAFCVSPAQFPWYAVWFLPLAALWGCWPLLLASATLPFYYLFYPLWAAGEGDTFFFGAAFLHSVPVLGWFIFDVFRKRRARFAVGVSV